jgi:hypothetical protein
MYTGHNVISISIYEGISENAHIYDTFKTDLEKNIGCYRTPIT